MTPQHQTIQAQRDRIRNLAERLIYVKDPVRRDLLRRQARAEVAHLRRMTAAEALGAAAAA